jgi:hypothetical protein
VLRGALIEDDHLLAIPHPCKGIPSRKELRVVRPLNKSEAPVLRGFFRTHQSGHGARIDAGR